MTNKEEIKMQYEDFIHPNKEALAKRDAFVNSFLSAYPDIQFNEDGGFTINFDSELLPSFMFKESEDRKMTKKRTVVVSAFPCCGKTYAFEHYQDKYSILDSDSSKFSWIYDENYNKWRNPNFPANYIEHIKENIGKVDFIFVSSHLEVRIAMEEAGIRYCTVYPKKEMLNEWVGRMYRRGNSDEFIRFQIDHWDDFVNCINLEPHGFGLCRLGNGEYLDLDFLYNW